MAVFTSNQVNHVYVSKAVQASTLSSVGDIMCKKTMDNELYFLYKNAEGQDVRSDLIPIKNIMWARAVGGEHRSQKRELKQYKITVPSPTEGNTYSVNIEVVLHEGIETVYRKQGIAVATSSINSATKLCEALLKSLRYNFERDDYVKDLFTFTPIASGGSYSTLDDDYADGDTIILVTEKSQGAKYKAGIFANNAVGFEVTSEDVTVEKANSGLFVKNGYDITDLEYFALGERADLYRNIGWPNSYPSKLVASDPTDSTVYNLLQIHFAFTDSNEGVQKSEKDITIAIPEEGVTKINTLLAQIATLIKGSSDTTFNLVGIDQDSDSDYTDAGDVAPQASINILDIPGLKVIKILG